MKSSLFWFEIVTHKIDFKSWFPVILFEILPKLNIKLHHIASYLAYLLGLQSNHLEPVRVGRAYGSLVAIKSRKHDQ
jgi:hypothetical protein